MEREFIMPRRVISGAGALETAGPVLRQMGKKAMIVTGKVMVKIGNCAKVESVLKEQNVDYTVYSEIIGEPTDVMIENGLKQYRDENCDFLVAIGGGSPIDSMKAIGALVEKGGFICDFFGRTIDVKMPPMAAIPTTAGTGSEATQFTIITDTKRNIKMLLKGKVLMPDLAVCDPQFTMTAPPKITASTGLDALCHAMEAYTSRKAQPRSDEYALSAVKTIFEYLPRAFHNGDDAEAREKMATAATEAGIAFNNASVTLIHGMSRPIGALFHIPHGLSNAMLIKECLSFALEGAYDRFGALGRTIGAASPGDSDEAAAKKFLAAATALVEELETPTLEAYGVDRTMFFANIEKMAHDAMESGSPQNTIRSITQADVERIYKKLWN